MVEVEDDGLVLDHLDRHRVGIAVLPAGHEPRADDGGALRQRFLGHLGLGLGIHLAVGFLWLDYDLLGIADLHAKERPVESGNDLLGALLEGQGLLARAAVDDFAFVVLERVVDLDGRALLDSRLGLRARGRGGQEYQ